MSPTQSLPPEVLQELLELAKLLQQLHTVGYAAGMHELTLLAAPYY